MYSVVFPHIFDYLAKIDGFMETVLQWLLVEKLNILIDELWLLSFCCFDDPSSSAARWCFHAHFPLVIFFPPWILVWVRLCHFERTSGNAKFKGNIQEWKFCVWFSDLHFFYTKVIDSSTFEFVCFCANWFPFSIYRCWDATERHCLLRNARFSNVGWID